MKRENIEMLFKAIPSVQRTTFKAIHVFFFCFLFLVMNGQIVIAEQEYQINPIPAWVVPVHFEKPKSIPYKQITNGSYSLLVDRQVRIQDDKIEYFDHIVKKVVNADGVQEEGQISISFDPSYEKLTIHCVKIHRGGVISDQLISDNINVFRREAQMEYLIYDGSKIADIVLQDLRVGDIVELSYTIEGNNPVFADHYFNTFYLQGRNPVTQLQLRLMCSNNRKINFKQFRIKIDPIIVRGPDETEYLWSLKDIQPLITDTDLPDWYNPYPAVQISEMSSWKEVCHWALNLYKKEPNQFSEIESKAKSLTAHLDHKEDQLITLLRFVQDEIRYLGIEIGAGAYAPNDPDLTLQRRFGDCKDKSFLLKIMLEQIGIEAKIALVNTHLSDKIAEYLPSPIIFNHVIVRAQLNGKTYWLDPTLGYQRGTLDNLHQPEYGSALVLTEQTDDLTVMKSPRVQKFTKKISEIFNMKAGLDKPIDYTVQSVYSGAEADFMREQIATKNLQKIQKEYLDFSAKYYPNIFRKREMRVQDDIRDNVITITEYYVIDGVWEKNKPENQLEFQTYTWVISDYVKKPLTIFRSMPLNLEHPVYVQQKIDIFLPEEWNIKPETISISSDVVQFKTWSKYSDKHVALGYEFKTLTDHVKPKHMKEYVQKLKDIRDQLNYGLYYPLPDQHAEKSDSDRSDNGIWIGILCVILIVFIVAISVKLSGYTYRITETENINRENKYFPVSLLKFVLMSIVTLSLYEIYWFYKNWKYIKQRDKSTLWPFARVLFAPLWYFPLLKDINRESKILQRPPIRYISALAIAYFLIQASFKLPGLYGLISLLSFLPIIPCVFHIAKTDGFQGSEIVGNSKFKIRHILLVLFGGAWVLFIAASDMYLVPPNQVITGNKLSQRDLDFLKRKNILQDNETVDYYYTDDSFSFTNSGVLLTNLKIITYWKDDQGSYFYEEALLKEIKDIKVEFAKLFFDDTEIIIYRKEGAEFSIAIANDEKMDKEFVRLLRKRLSEVKKGVTSLLLTK